jgi:hypothetical protein
MAAMPFARIARQLATQGNIKVSNSGMNFSGHNSPAIPNAIPSWTTKHSPKLFTARDSNERIPFHWNVKEASRGSYQGFFAGWQTRGSKPPHCRLRNIEPAVIVPENESHSCLWNVALGAEPSGPTLE